MNFDQGHIALMPKPMKGVIAYDTASVRWHAAEVLRVFYEDYEWWIEVKFLAGGRCSLLRGEGVR